MSKLDQSFVAITGIGIIAPSLLNFDYITKDRLNSLKKEKVVANVPLPEGQNSRELRRLSKLARMAVGAADQALCMSKKSTGSMGTGVALSHGSTSYLSEFHDLLFNYGPDNASPSAFSNGITNSPLSTISTMYKLTSGGVTYTGLESTGIDMLSYGAEAVVCNEYDSFLAGAAEEYSPLVEHIYSQIGWYKGSCPGFLPWEECTTAGDSISEGSAFLVFEPLTDDSCSRAFALYKPVSIPLQQIKPDLIISCAGGGPQDLYENNLLKRILTAECSDVVFTSSVFGNCFALSGVFSAVLACACIRSKSNIVPRVLYNPDIAQYIHTKETVSSVLITGAARDGQISCGLLCSPENSGC
jgi:3-oxoacyl-(acyl-carrier-protein) synthase